MLGQEYSGRALVFMLMTPSPIPGTSYGFISPSKSVPLVQNQVQVQEPDNAKCGS